MYNPFVSCTAGKEFYSPATQFQHILLGVAHIHTANTAIDVKRFCAKNTFNIFQILKTFLFCFGAHIQHIQLNAWYGQYTAIMYDPFISDVGGKEFRPAFHVGA